MEQKNYLGIYFQQHRAVAALVAQQQDGPVVTDLIEVSTAPDTQEQKQQKDQQQQEQQQPGSLAEQLAEACAERQLEFAETAVVLDCNLYAQHSLHSEFADRRQIAQTVKFDAEDAFAMDASSLAVTFNILETDEQGAKLNVFAAEKKLLGDILTDLQNNGFDPVSIEPDVTALARFTPTLAADPSQQPAMVAAFSEQACYLVIPVSGRDNPVVRSLLITAGQDKTGMLASQIPLTLASIAGGETPNRLAIIDPSGSVSCEQLSQRLGMPVENIEFTESAGLEPEPMEGCSDAAFGAIAFGAALGAISRAARPDFRTDFAPYQGRKILIEKTVRILSISLTVLMLTIGLYFQLRTFRMKDYTSRLHTKLEKQYVALMRDRNMPADFIRKLNSEVNRLKAGTTGRRMGEESVPELLTFTLDALNKTDSAIDLNIDSISIREKSVLIIGDTRSRQHTRLFQIIDGHPRLRKGPSTYSHSKGRDNFRLTVLPRTG